jgi:hypothetical protein
MLMGKFCYIQRNKLFALNDLLTEHHCCRHGLTWHTIVMNTKESFKKDCSTGKHSIESHYMDADLLILA